MTSIVTIVFLSFSSSLGELSETGLSVAEEGKSRAGRQDLFQSRILLSVTPKHGNFTNFIR